jgi:hypothetical protein
VINYVAEGFESWKVWNCWRIRLPNFVVICWTKSLFKNNLCKCIKFWNVFVGKEDNLLNTNFQINEISQQGGNKVATRWHKIRWVDFSPDMKPFKELSCKISIPFSIWEKLFINFYLYWLFWLNWPQLKEKLEKST